MADRHHEARPEPSEDADGGDAGGRAVVPGAATIVGLLAEPQRRRVAAALVLGASTVGEVRAATGLPTRAVATALGRLEAGGLVERVGDADHVLLGEAFQRAAVAAVPATPPEDDAAGLPDDVARVLRTYLRDGRLTHIPVQRAKRLVVLDRLAQEFEVGIRYPERRVNAALRRFHDDVAALRRYLVDEGFMDREAGLYWRSGGTVSGP